MSASASAQTELTRLAASMHEFLASCRAPAINEPGEDLLVLEAGAHFIEEHAGRIFCGQRGIIDLLAAGRDGCLTLIELKAAEDVHLPMQALD